MLTQKRKWFFWKFIVAVIVVIVANVIETRNVYTVAHPTKTFLNDGNDIHHHHYHEHHEHFHALPPLLSSRINTMVPTSLPLLSSQQQALTLSSATMSPSQQIQPQPQPQAQPQKQPQAQPQQQPQAQPQQQQQPQAQAQAQPQQQPQAESQQQIQSSPASITKIPTKSMVAEPSMIVEQEYRPAPGEILAKDSILYSKKPGTIQLRRQLWPIMEKTMNNLAESVTLGANNLFKTILRPNGGGDYRLQKAINIKNVLTKQQHQHQLLPKPMAYKQQIKTIQMIKKPLKMQLPKSTIVKIKETPIGTISEDYILNYSDSPNYSIKTKPKQVNLFTDMGVTGYKHFEQTVLRELEKKEELKVEATMSSLFENNKFKDYENQFNNNNNHGDGGVGSEWIPMSPGEIPTTENPPHPVTHLHTNVDTNIVKPVHEHIIEADHNQVPKLIFEDSASNKLVVSIPPISPTPNYKPEQPKSLRTPTTTPQPPPPPPFTTPVSVSMLKMKPDVEESSPMPNYPEYYLKKNKNFMTDNLKLIKEVHHHHHQSNHNQHHQQQHHNQHKEQHQYQQHSNSSPKALKLKKKPKNTNNNNNNNQNSHNNLNSNRKETNLMKPEFMEAQASSSGIFTAAPLIKSKPTVAATAEAKYASVRDEQRPRRRPHRQENIQITKPDPVVVDAQKGNTKIKSESSVRSGRRGNIRFGGSNF